MPQLVVLGHKLFPSYGNLKTTFYFQTCAPFRLGMGVNPFQNKKLPDLLGGLGRMGKIYWTTNNDHNVNIGNHKSWIIFFLITTLQWSVLTWIILLPIRRALTHCWVLTHRLNVHSVCLRTSIVHQSIDWLMIDCYYFHLTNYELWGKLRVKKNAQYKCTPMRKVRGKKKSCTICV